MRSPRPVAVLALALACLSCGEDGADDSSLIPADYPAEFVEVRNCRQSGDHDLNVIRVTAGPMALGPYRNRDAPFPVGALVVKEEFEFGDDDCAGPIKQYTVMSKLAVGTADERLGWDWQTVDGDGGVLEENVPSCWGCHIGCGSAPDGYDGTCTVP